MIQTFAGVFTAFGLATAAGLNAYLPLLIVALMARFTDLITLAPPWDALTSPWVIGLLAVLLAIEIVADKVPAVDHANDVIQTVVRPAAGAILFAANGNVISDMTPVLALILGILAAGSVHAAKATFRPVVTATTGGLGNPVVSTVEDIVSAALTFLAILVPVLTFVLLLALIFLVWRWWRQRKARSAGKAVAVSSTDPEQ